MVKKKIYLRIKEIVLFGNVNHYITQAQYNRFYRYLKYFEAHDIPYSNNLIRRIEKFEVREY